MPLDILPRRIHIGEGALAFGHFEVHQFAGRVVNIDEQGALRPAILEPPVLRPIDLDQLAPAVAPVAWLIWARAPGFAILPQPGLDHELAQRLAGQMNIVPFGQILTGQRGAEIIIMLTHDRDHALAKIISIAPVAGPAALG